YTMDRFKQVGWEVAREYIKKYPNIEYVEGDAIDMLGDLPDNINIAFIDADKRQTQLYFDILIDKMANTGIIIVDDVLWRGEVIDPQNHRAKVLDDFNKYINLRKDVSNLVLPIRHGVNIIRKIKES
ncbi:MAG: caffeoyl-CoA O-methyltransferase, partial [Francisella sp.]